MKIILISDTHSQHHRLVLPPGDMIIHAGDFSKRGRTEEVEDFFSWFGQLPYQYRICIAGNHDFMAENFPEAFQQLVPDTVIYLNDSGVVVEGIRFWGSPITPWFFDWAFNRRRGAEIRPHWALIPADTDVLITHGPPYSILDRVARDGSPVGCRDLLRTVQEIQPKIHVFGHIHEGYGEVIQGGVRYINASVLDENYALVNRPVEAIID